MRRTITTIIGTTAAELLLAATAYAAVIVGTVRIGSEAQRRRIRSQRWAATTSAERIANRAARVGHTQWCRVWPIAREGRCVPVATPER